jgi:hypothetical protein
MAITCRVIDPAASGGQPWGVTTEEDDMIITDNTLFLRRVLGLDAVASGGTGLLLAFGSGLLEPLLGLDPAFTGPAGWFLIVYALAVAGLAMQGRPARPLVMAVIAVNGLWAIESVMTLMLGWLQPNLPGVAFVAVQALVVAGFAGLQAVALRSVRQAV